MDLIKSIDLSQIKDWAGLKYYQHKNFNVDLKKEKVVFMGDSITEWWEKHNPSFFAENNYINRGISGQTTPQMLIRFRQDVIDLNPSKVVILAGINDIAGNTGPSTIKMTTDNIISMVEIAKANDIKVLLCSVLPASTFDWRGHFDPREIVLELNRKIKEYATNNNILYVDYFNEMSNNSNGLREDLGKDGVHPNSKGYSIMIPIINDALASIEDK